MSAPRHGRRAALAALGFGTLMGLNGCTTFGGNVKGSFTCRAPDGICAPSSTIDDRALAMISGDAGDVMIPAGPYPTPARQPRALRAAVAAPLPDAPGQVAPRTREKVLRIVFQPYVDDRGRLHESSAVHAVVQSEWQAQVLADATPIPDSRSAEAPVQLSLADAVEREAPGVVDVTAFDPNMPDLGVVAAARARKSDPVAAIKADVASRLATEVKPAAGAPASTSSATGSQRPTASATATKRAAGGDETAAAGVPASRRSEATPQAKQRSEGAPATSTVSGREAAARVKASQEYQEAQERVESSARGAAEATPAPGLSTLTSPTVRAASFPAAVPEDN
ncbi:TraV family lipoprotein [Sphingomonas paucimobilis]|uniref:TraV family lipoprotein n=1 Tax=Sphingomonas paucimobilis TaxID=13689 RepID=UPI0037904B11